MQQLAVISGKGGTGKTSVVASFAALTGETVLVDCDVDAADLHLVLSPTLLERHEFRSGHLAKIRQAECSFCGECMESCRFDAIKPAGDGFRYQVDPVACEGCRVCVEFCPVQAIDFEERTCGEWYISETSHGPMVHARLGIAAENSGKLVTTVRQAAQQIAEKRTKSLLLIDGPPGIGCPVIASITGTSFVLIVTEPTLSALHDFDRVVSLTAHFRIPTAVCTNKWDLNPEITTRIEQTARARNVSIAGRIRYDSAVTRAQVEGLSTVEYGGEAAEDIREVWQRVRSYMTGLVQMSQRAG
ncbi:MAG: (4Fe-4S)-binding protein [Acidobacteria bacterium]|nr:MAG: (4Fe-4S)-binding protein [Acidobacteriota bacterium]